MATQSGFETPTKEQQDYAAFVLQSIAASHESVITLGEPVTEFAKGYQEGLLEAARLCRKVAESDLG